MSEVAIWPSSLHLPAKRPLIQLELCRSAIELRIVLIESLRGGEVLRALVPDVGLGRLNRVGIGGCFGACGSDVGGGIREGLVVGLFQETANPLLGLIVVSFAEVVITDVARRVDEVVRRPILVIEGAPDAIVVIHRDGIGDAEVVHGLPHVGFVFFERKLRRMNADDDETAVFVLLVPGLDVGQSTQAVDAGEYVQKSTTTHLAAKRGEV